jgi:molybdopterin molybdotransferase
MIKPNAASGAVSARMLVPLRQAMLHLGEGLAPVDPATLPLGQAAGCVLAEPLIAASEQPAQAVALRAGYAVVAADTFGASAYAPVTLAESPAWVEPGGSLPPGCDAVIEADAVLLRAGRAELAEPVAPGTGNRRTGEDAPAGGVLRQAGARLRPLDVALAGAAGLTHVAVRIPRLLVIETGSAGAASACADLVAGMAAASGAAVSRAQAETLADEAADLIVMVGEPNRLRAALPPRATIVADGLAICPGEEAIVARIGTVPVLIVPPLVDAALALALLLIVPLLRQLAGAHPEPEPVAAPLSDKIVSVIGFTEIALLRREGAEWAPIVAGDLPWRAIAAAEAWLAIEPGQEGYPAGRAVAAQAL